MDVEGEGVGEILSEAYRPAWKGTSGPGLEAGESSAKPPKCWAQVETDRIGRLPSLRHWTGKQKT